MPTLERFLVDQPEPRPVADVPGPFGEAALWLGEGGAEVQVVTMDRAPTRGELRAAWEHRRVGRTAPILLAALHSNGRGDLAAFCGSWGQEKPCFAFDRHADEAERFCAALLDQPDEDAAARFLYEKLPRLEEGGVPGLRNEGLLSLHELTRNVPNRPDWPEAARKAAPLLRRRGKDLFRGLGFTSRRATGAYEVLTAPPADGASEGEPLAVTVRVDPRESCERELARFDSASPVAYALDRASREGLRLVVVEHGADLRLYPARAELATGKGTAETYLELSLDLLPKDQAALLWLLFSAKALTPGGSLDEIFRNSRERAVDLGARLRDRIYDDVLPDLALAVSATRGIPWPDAEQLRETYGMALTALFRLLFVAYAEDRELLPYRLNDAYTENSLKTLARELADRPSGDTFGDETGLWDRASALWAAVDRGRPDWEVPAYNGGLFSADPAVSPEGAALAGLSLPDVAFGPPLAALLLDVPDAGGEKAAAPIDFRDLGVREFGTIYEGLLESELSLAETNLTVDREGRYRPLPEDSDVAPAVRAGEVYLHNASGVRKASGSYYTPHFAVEHLLDGALEPALTDHLGRLDKLSDAAAAERFFDFRVADIAMGSGHFLVAAVDRIERRLGDYLVERPLPAVLDELNRLRDGVAAALGDRRRADAVTDRALLRRQIARRCVYGVDLSPMAVQLARLSVWVHSFVPGLPLSFLDHNLVRGNALVGVATEDEVAEMLRGGESRGLFDHSIDALLGNARGALTRLAKLSDADAAQIAEARRAHREARAAARDLERMLDILTAARLPDADLPPLSPETFADSGDLLLDGLQNQARAALGGLEPFHFPVAFPEVFLRDRPGFDCLLGNPPWEEATLEEDRFWIRHEPGLQALPQRDQEAAKKRLRKDRPDLVATFEAEKAKVESLRASLIHGPFPGMGTGDPDLYKGFAWRFLTLPAADGGRAGVVLPRSLWSVKGNAEFREAALSAGSVAVTFLTNNRGWVFPEVHPQYTVALSAFGRTAEGTPVLSLSGPFRNLAAFARLADAPPVTFPAAEARTWTDTAALPLLPAEGSAEVFARLRKAPRLDHDASKEWRARPYRELDATNDKKHLLFTGAPPPSCWPVLKGESFDLWEPDRGADTYYAWADPEVVIPVLQTKRWRSRNNRRSPWGEFESESWKRDPATLPCHATP